MASRGSRRHQPCPPAVPSGVSLFLTIPYAFFLPELVSVAREGYLHKVWPG